MGFLPEAEVRRVVGYASRKGVRQYGILAQRSPYGDLAARAMDEAVRRNGGTLRVETVPPDDPAAFARGAQSLAGSGQLEAVMIPMFGDSLKTAAAALSSNGVDRARTRYLGTAQWEQTPLFTEPALTGAWIAAVAPQNRQEFETRYASTYGRPAPRLATLAYDATALAAALSMQPGGARYDAASLTSPRGFTGADGYFRFAADGTAERGLAVLEVTPNGLRVIDPAPTRAEELLF
jgi:branched-chain amino acid transport system substrate-binding protein